MFSGHNVIGFSTGSEGSKKVKVFSTIRKEYLPEEFVVATENEIEEAAIKAAAAFEVYKKVPFTKRADFLEAIAEEIANVGDKLIQRAMLEASR